MANTQTVVVRRQKRLYAVTVDKSHNALRLANPARLDVDHGFKFPSHQRRLGPPISDEPISLRLRCSGQLHTITLQPDGRLVLEHHADKGKDQAFRVQECLGGPKVRCANILDRWRDKSPNMAVHGSLNWIRQCYFARKYLRKRVRRLNIVKPSGRMRVHLTFDRLASDKPLIDRLAAEIVSGIPFNLKQCRFYAKQKVRLSARVTVSAPPKIASSTTYYHDRHGYQTIRIDLGVPLAWQRIRPRYKTVGGHLVIECGQPEKTGKITKLEITALRVIATKQGPIPVLQRATAYGTGTDKNRQSWWLAWRKEKPQLPERITFY